MLKEQGLKSRLLVWRALKEGCSKKYLDWAEVLPEFNGGRIKLLQTIRRRQREEAQKQFEESRPQEGAELHFDQLLLVELFPIEDYDELERQLRRLFSGDEKLERGIEFIADNAGGLSGGAWCNIGHLVRKESNSSLYPFAVATLPNLPEEVQQVDVSVIKITSSLFAVSLSVELTDEASDKLNAVLNRRFLPEVTFRGVLPTRMNLSNRSMSQSKHVMRVAVMRSLDGLRLKIECALRSRFKGLFLRMPRGLSPRLPAIEMHSIKHAGAGSATIDEVINRNAAWVNCFGLTHWRQDCLFACPEMIFQFPSKTHDEESTAYKIVTLKQNAASASESQDSTYFRLKDMSESLRSLIAVSGLLESVQENIETLRFKVYRTLVAGRASGGLVKDIQLNNQVQLRQMILERLRFELKEDRWQLEDAAKGLESFACLDKRRSAPLGAAFLKDIKVRLERLTGHSGVVTDALSAYLQRRNLDVTYRLQRNLFRWTIVISIVTVLLSVVATYAIVKDWPSFHFVLKWFQRVA
jgi:hypothetical protein